ncbi:Gfo/Idh/MocA family oxidoreductase [soil metagenome]
MKRVRVGVIGLGEVAQVIHLPILEALSDRFELTAICDISPMLLTVLGERYRIPEERRFADYEMLVASTDLDAVFVLNSDEYHADCAIAAMNHGLHVLIEKPMSLNQADAERIVAARDNANVQAMVGYMRRFAPAFLEALEEVKRLEKINYVRVRDIIGRNRIFIDQTSNVIRPVDFPEAAMVDRRERAAAQVREAIGDAADRYAGIYRLLCGLSSHDLSAMRELVGMPKRVVSASLHPDGRFLVAVMEFDGFHAVLETGVDELPRFDAHLQVYAPDRTILVQYDSPYVRHLPTTLNVVSTDGASLDQRTVRPTLTDPYTRELEHFYDVVVNGTPPKTTPEDFQEDLKLFQMIVNALPQAN